MPYSRLLFLLLIIFGSSLNAQSQQTLAELNPEWLNQDDIDINNIDIVATTPVELIQQHLLLAEQTLRLRSTEHLDASQKAGRERCLDILHDYALTGVYPTNTDYAESTPIFIDNLDVFCAVGHLMKETGYEQLARHIDAVDERVFVRNIRNPEAAEWMHKFGLSLGECALIQPSYCPPDSLVLIRDHIQLDLTGLDTLNSITNRNIPGTNINFDAELTRVILDTLFADEVTHTYVVDSNQVQLSYLQNAEIYCELHISFSQPGVYLYLEEVPISFLFDDIDGRREFYADSMWVNNGKIIEKDTFYHDASNILCPYVYSPRFAEQLSTGTALVRRDSNITSGNNDYDGYYPMEFSDSQNVAKSTYIFEPLNTAGTTTEYTIGVYGDDATGDSTGMHIWVSILDSNITTDTTHSVVDLRYEHSSLQILGANASHDIIQVTYEKDIADQPIQVFSVEGRRLAVPIDQQAHKARLDISSLAPGIYFIRMGDQLNRFQKL